MSSAEVPERHEDYIDAQVYLFGFMIEVQQFAQAHAAIMEATANQFDILDGLIDDLAAGNIGSKPGQA